MSLATMTTKGQVTIPKDVRESLRLHAGDKIEVVPTENGEAIIRPITKTVDEVFGSLKRTGQKPVSVEEMDEAIAQHLRNNWR